MKLIEKVTLGLLLAGVLISTGCGSDKYPNELSLEDAPETIAEAFKDEKNANIKSMATRATQLLKARNYTVAHGILKQLMTLSDLTPEQRDLIAGGMMAVAENLQKAAEQGNAHVVISAKIEEEISQLDAEEAEMFLAEMGLEEAGLDRLIRAGYDLLHLETYFTVGPKEARAWTIRAGTQAPQAAGVIHGDFEKGFIRAETIAYEDFVALGGEQGAKEAGKMRAEGKTYTVRDGDVMHFLFNT